MIASLIGVAAAIVAGFTFVMYSASLHLGYLFITAPVAIIITAILWGLHCTVVDWASYFGVGLEKEVKL